jgi:superoxide dismutase, Cu-Zn family
MTFKKLAMTTGPCALAMALAGCGSTNTTTYSETPAEADGTGAMANADPAAAAAAAAAPVTASLKTADGKDVGTVTATPGDGMIMVSVAAMGMTAGDHGIHIHTVGKCDGPKFESAGSHWNPTGAKHGLSNPEGSHGGDMPNLTIAGDGTGKLEYSIKEAVFADLQDADGAAVVIHAKADDQMTDPSGDSGDRLACGVFAKG